MRKKTVVTRLLPTEVIEKLQAVSEVTMWPTAENAASREFLLREIKDADALLSMLTDSIDAELIAQGKKLRIIANMAVGYDNIDLQAAKSQGIYVTNTPDVLNETTADLAFALLLTTARRIPEAIDFLRSGEWRLWSPFLLAGQDVYGATLGIVGMGRIGEAVAKRARGFAMHVLYHNRQRKPEVEERLGVTYATFDDLLRQADFVMVLTPLTESTYHMIGERELHLMKKTAILINVSRGSVVDEHALYQALRMGEIHAAGLDVFEQEPIPPDHPLLQLQNVVALPHIGSASRDTRMHMAMLAADNICAVLAGGDPITSIV
ncbi:2-hydroxyacid dehydrogenase [Sulfoacidibacillus thermotolerans]|uniref:D-glycerate dehydrogenase n=1 Tax=Sulfoacidibacillus thermotolerans TaxID=1765684 RepID=A0A2U3DB66_SULT2|nr:D-glycerate dehydrogenase [Sulfoacidibacillus thermotolerans]PWI58502.1 D-glycerate dehydrogenase [Sulfoacidibacillus thermotolerans]